MVKVKRAKRIALVMHKIMTKDVHMKLEDLGYEFADEKDGHCIYESKFLVDGKEEVDIASTGLRDASIPIYDAYVFTKKSHVHVGR